MKMNKKHIIILIVAVVAVYLVLKNRKKEDNPSSGNSSANVPHAANDIESVMAAVGLLDEEKKAVRHFSPELSYQAWIQELADKRGLTYDQNKILAALWDHYHKADGSWVSSSAESRCQDVYNKIMSKYSVGGQWV